jgi:hypothetical protein
MNRFRKENEGKENLAYFLSLIFFSKNSKRSWAPFRKPLARIFILSPFSLSPFSLLLDFQIGESIVLCKSPFPQ